MKFIVKQCAKSLLLFFMLSTLSCSFDSGRDVVVAVGETAQVVDDDDAADDSVLLSSLDGQVVWIVGTNKRRGLVWYDLSGKELGRLDVGRLNNVDAVRIENSNRFKVAAGNRTDLSVDFFEADMDAGTIVKTEQLGLTLDDAYGLCVSESRIAIGDKSGNVQILDWKDKSLKDSLRFQSSTEGCVFDIAAARLFVGEEEKGIWMVDMSTGEMSLFDDITNGNLTADIEGLDIYDRAGRKYLLASSQGDDSFVVYDLDTGQIETKFHIAGSQDGAIDEVTHTDGVAILSMPVRDFSEGILVVQDDENFDKDGGPENQNFKLVDWRSISRLIGD